MEFITNTGQTWQRKLSITLDLFGKWTGKINVKVVAENACEEWKSNNV